MVLDDGLMKVPAFSGLVVIDPPCLSLQGMAVVAQFGQNTGMSNRGGVMKKQVYLGLPLLLVLGLAAAYWQNMYGDAPAVAPTAQAQAINQCDLIAGKAAAALPEALPFQRLEKAARQAHVLEQCMQDQGYQQNPVWEAAARSQATRLAAEQQVSADEAYETLRRQAMLQSGHPPQPDYWRRRN